MNTAIKITELTKDYGKLKALDSLSLEIGEGEFFGLLGINGAGKSTAIRILSCLSAPSAGDAEIFGHSITKESEKVKEIINLSPQDTAVAPNLSVFENLELIAGLHGKGKTEAKRLAWEYIEKLGLSDVAKKRAKALSGGYQRRLSIAMALITDPKVLFLDEPTLGLDVLARRELWQFIEGLRGKLTLILTTHYMEEAEALCDRIAIINKGRLCALGTADELKAKAGCADFEEAFIKLCGGDGQ